MSALLVSARFAGVHFFGQNSCWVGLRRGKNPEGNFQISWDSLSLPLFILTFLSNPSYKYFLCEHAYQIPQSHANNAPAEGILLNYDAPLFPSSPLPIRMFALPQCNARINLAWKRAGRRGACWVGLCVCTHALRLLGWPASYSSRKSAGALLGVVVWRPLKFRLHWATRASRAFAAEDNWRALLMLCNPSARQTTALAGDERRLPGGDFWLSEVFRSSCSTPTPIPVTHFPHHPTPRIPPSLKLDGWPLSHRALAFSVPKHPRTPIGRSCYFGWPLMGSPYSIFIFIPSALVIRAAPGPVSRDYVLLAVFLCHIGAWPCFRVWWGLLELMSDSFVCTRENLGPNDPSQRILGSLRRMITIWRENRVKNELAKLCCSVVTHGYWSVPESFARCFWPSPFSFRKGRSTQGKVTVRTARFGAILMLWIALSLT